MSSLEGGRIRQQTRNVNQLPNKSLNNGRKMVTTGRTWEWSDRNVEQQRTKRPGYERQQQQQSECKVVTRTNREQQERTIEQYLAIGIGVVAVPIAGTTYVTTW